MGWMVTAVGGGVAGADGVLPAGRDALLTFAGPGTGMGRRVRYLTVILLGIPLTMLYNMELRCCAPSATA